MLSVVVLDTIPSLTQPEFDSLLQLVQVEKQARIKRFRFLRDAHNCLLGDVLARAEICRIAGLSNEQLVFSANAHGKPCLTNNPGIHFNISHSGHYVACATSDEPVGVDVEVFKPIDLALAVRFFTPNEVAYIRSGDQTCRFFEVWTKKESRIKREGKGLSMPLPSFDVLQEEGQESFFYHKVFQNSEAMCHVCSGESSSPSLRVIDTSFFAKDGKSYCKQGVFGIE